MPDLNGQTVLVVGRRSAHSRVGRTFARVDALMESLDALSARAWYESPAYQLLKAMRHCAARNNAVLIAG